MRLHAYVNDDEIGTISFEAAKELAELRWVDVSICTDYDCVEDLYEELRAEAELYEIFCGAYGVEPAFTAEDLIEDEQEVVDWLLSRGLIDKTKIRPPLKIDWNFSEK